MPINIDILDFECFNQLRNGVDFDQNLSAATPNLVGNVGEKVKVSFKAQISQSSFTESAEEWEVLPAIKEIRRSSGSFLDDSVQVGDTYDFYPDWSGRKTAVSEEYRGVVDFISSNGRVLKYTVATGSDTTAGVVANVGMAFPQLYILNFNTAFFLKFGLLGNDETFNFLSKTTENQQVYYTGGIDTLGIVYQAEPLGKIRDWVSGASTVENLFVTPDFKEATYEITHEFILNPFYILAYREFIDNDTIPELLAGDSSIKYAAELEFRKTLTNTGSSKTQSFDHLKGFVGWYGENFNGLNAKYKVASVTYEEDATGDPLDAVNINTPTKAIITVEGLTGAITDYSCSVYIIKVPDSEDDYIGTETDLLENFLYKSEIVSSPATSTPNVVTSLVSGDLVIEYTIDYTVAEKLQLTTGDEFMLLVQVEDPTISAGNSDRLMLIASLQNYVDVDFLSDFINVFSYAFLQHGENLTEDNGTTNPVVSDEDGILLDAVIGANTTREVTINAVSVKLIAYNSIENKSFELDQYNFNIGDLVLSGGVQQINVDSVRGYVLPIDDEFNLAKIQTGIQSGDYRQYSLQLGQKIKWQDWIVNPRVDNVFFDSGQLNNNLNEKTSNYSGEQGYVIKLALVVNVTGLDDLGRPITGDFINYGGDITVNDYGESEDGVSGTIQTFDLETGNSLEGDILYNGKDTLFKAVFQNAGAMLYGLHRVEPSQNQGDGILELSSLFLPSPNNLLKPVAGETQLKFTLAAGVLTTECLIDGSLIQEGIDYKLSARTGISGQPINPLTLFGANLHAWYRLDDVILGAEGVSQLNDKSENVRHLVQAVGAQQPFHSALDPDLDNRPYMDAAPPVRYLDDIGNWAGLGSDPYFYVVVMKIESASTGRTIFTRNDAGDSFITMSAHNLWYGASSRWLRNNIDITNGVEYYRTGENSDVRYAMAAAMRGNNHRWWFEGTEDVPTTSNTGVVVDAFNTIRVMAPADLGLNSGGTKKVYELFFVKGNPEDYVSEFNSLHVDYLAPLYPSLNIQNPNLV